MVTVAKLASRLNWHRNPHPLHAGKWPCFFLFTDQHRLPDPMDVLQRLPRGAAVVLRHPDQNQLRDLARRIVPAAHRLGLLVLLAGDVRLALQYGCDGVHLSQHRARRGPQRILFPGPDFLITAAAHDAMSLRRAARAGAHVVMLSPVFATQSHVGAKPMGALRFARLAARSVRPVIALGGVTPRGAKRLSLGPACGIGAIGAWRA